MGMFDISLTRTPLHSLRQTYAIYTFTVVVAIVACVYWWFLYTWNVSKQNSYKWSLKLIQHVLESSLESCCGIRLTWLWRGIWRGLCKSWFVLRKLPLAI